ncbi:uncharacterized protein LOC107267038 isoform X2 [Cephus cinctus]|uniref:Uncharacterized protein LOC107267038 isoform X2 n=1 Tax=Cephus cinctus TaxID=211228 RepID=A0AAJ7W0H5_CEPCN|nr:uncharacterized protein LOC107267038 isoform X2 [Cephus cinctus]XP_024940026.1 uncharacterized protein LOC107267038 isoform X2 [Cephus cinctus]XP_024940027.1 uncharacterized protein LOC107267038 isoform X2 [Cephus cinctus]
MSNAVDRIKTTKVTEQMNNLDNYTMHRQPHVYSNQKNEIETTNIDKTICHDMSMELTTAIPFCISSYPGTSNTSCTTLTQKKQYSNPSNQSYLEGINMRSNTISSDLNNSIDLENKTMDFTTAVTHEDPFSQFILNKENINHLPYTEGNTADSFMEYTAPVERTKKFANQSMVLTECIPSKYMLKINTESAGKIYGSRDYIDELHQDKPNITLNYTEMEKTKIFCDTSIEMTNAVRSAIQTRDSEISHKRNETLGNMSMEMTTVISQAKSLIKTDDTIDKMNQSAKHENFNVAKNILTNKVNVDQTISERTEQTKCFQNMPMELTTLVSTHVTNNNPTDNIKLAHKKRNYLEYLEYCEETGIETTKEYLEATKIVEENKTKMFKDMSMEITTAIPLAASIVQGRIVQNFDNSVLQPILVEPVEQFTVTNDKDSRDNVNRTTRNNDQELDTESNITKLFKNVPMEMTTAIRQTTPTFQEDVSSSSKNYNEHEKLVERKDTDDVIEHQEITNTVTENIYDKMIVEPRKSILVGNTSMEQETGISESPFNLHSNRTYNIKIPRIYHNLSETIGKIAATVTEDNSKNDTPHMSISNQAINENRLLENESMDITHRIAISAEAPAKNVSTKTETCVDINQTKQLSKNTSPTKRTYVIIPKGCCTQVNESVANDTDIVMGCEEVCINKNDSDQGNISIYNSEPIHAGNSILSEKINAAEVINKDTSNISVIGDEMYMTDIENRPTCLISNDSYEEKNDSQFHELSSEKKELIYSEENDKRILPISTEENGITEALTNISSHIDVVEDPFVIWMNGINVYSERDDCIWNVRCLNEKIFALDFISSSLVVVMHFENVENKAINNFQRIKIISRLKDTADPILRLVHRIILDKIDPGSLIKTYCMPDDFFPLTEHISRDVVFAMDFMFEYKWLHNIAMIDIIDKRIQFTVWTKTVNTILNISIEINTLNSISFNNVEVECILGSIRVNDIKKLIVNAKKDHRYLSRCINDVKEYLAWMEDTG